MPDAAEYIIVDDPWRESSKEEVQQLAEYYEEMTDLVDASVNCDWRYSSANERGGDASDP